MADAATPDRALVHARGLTKRFDTLVAVDGIAFDVDRGEAFGFLGPDGAGKTSTMRVIGCVSPPSGGTLRVLGMDPLVDGPRIRARLGVVPQADTLDRELSVEENMLTYARYFDLPWRLARQRSRELLDFVQLTERAKDDVEPRSPRTSAAEIRRSTLLSSVPMAESSTPRQRVQIPTDMQAFNRALIAEFRASGGKLSGPMAGRSLLLLTTTGARSGKPRTTVLGYGKDGGSYVAIASNNAAAAHPAWYTNLLANSAATVEVGPEKLPVRARTARPEERDHLAKAVPWFDGQQKLTDREIPIVVFEPTID